MSGAWLQTALRPSTPAGRFARRLIGLLLLLAAELQLLSQLADSAAVGGREWWAIILRKSPNLAQAGLMAGSLCLLLGTAMLWSLWRRHYGRFRTDPPLSRRWLALHLTLFAALVAATLLVFSPRIRLVAAPEAWVVGWCLLVAGTALSWVLTVIPQPLWRDFLPRGVQIACVAAPFGIVGWAAGRLSRELWDPLTAATLRTVALLLAATGQTCITDAERGRIGTPSFQIGILDGCSGYQGIGLTTALLAGFCLIFRKQLRFPQVLLLFPVAVLASWLANAARIAGLILVGTHVSRDMALGGFHSQAGWIAFCAIGIAAVFVMQRVAWFQKEPHRAGPIAEGRRAGSAAPLAYLLPFLASIAAGMLAAVGSVSVDFTAAAQVVVGASVLFWLRRDLEGALMPRWSWGAMMAGTGVCALWILMSLLRTPEADGAAGPSWLGQTSPWRPLLGAVWCVNAFAIVPIVEELAFRGYLLRRLQSVHFETVPATRCTWTSLLGSSVLFGLLHPEHLVAGTVAGLAYATVMLSRGRVSDAILAHATTNVLLAAYAWNSGHWQAWG